MKGIRFFLSIYFLLPIYLIAQTFPVLEFQKFYENPSVNDYVRRLVKTTDGHIVIGGYSKNVADVCTDARFVKIDTTGKLIWEKKIALLGCQEVRDMVATPDTGIIFVGVTTNVVTHPENADDGYKSDIWIGKINKKGETVWLKTYGGDDADYGYSIANRGEAYYLAGSSFSSNGDVFQNNGAGDVLCMRLDSRGNPRSSVSLGGKGSEWVKNISICKNGDLILAGFTNSVYLPGNISRFPPTRNGNAMLMRLKEDGSMVWLRTYPTPYGGVFNQVQEDQQGRIIVAGSYNVQAYDAQFWLLKLTADGKIIIDQKSGNMDNEYLTSLAVCPDTSYFFGGYSNAVRFGGDSLSKGKDDFWLIKMDRFGNVIWRKVYGGGDRERCLSVLAYKKGLLFAVGEKENYFTGEKKGDTDIWLLKITDHQCDSLPLNMFIRANENNEVDVNQPIRFRAQHNYGERFLWDFGDGTTSSEEQPLKTFAQKGEFEVNLTVYYSEACAASFTYPRKVVVK